MSCFRYTPEMITWLGEHYKSMTQPVLAAEFNRRFGCNKKATSLATTLKRYGLKSGRTGRFEPGKTPWNKGVKGLDFGGRETRFKKGNVPANTKPLHTERVTRDGYIEIKIAERNPYTGAATRYKHKHVWLWEQAHGRRVPDGHAVIFRDGNRLNSVIENLRLISRAELRYLNWHGLSLGELPEGAREPTLTLAKLETTVQKMMRERKA